ncbi:MAG: helicase-related protein, partial [Nanoarchaeota archaeon]
RFSGRENLQKFLDVNPDKNKCKKLIETLNNTKRPETRSKEILPVLELMKKIHKSNRGKAEYYKFSCLSIDNLRKLAENLEGTDASKLKELLDLPIRWVKIKEKQEYNDEKEVYDLTVEKHHNFIANSLINHNCIANDLRKGMYNLKDVCLLIEDEAHRCIKNYDYNYIAQEYMKQSIHPRLIGLTASPGSEKPKIKDICKNLFIEEVELRGRESLGVKEYLQELEFEKIMLDFPPEFEDMRKVLLKLFNEYVEELRVRKVLFGPASKTDLINLQKRMSAAITRNYKNFNYLLAASACAQAIKLQHALELLETQTLEGFNKYMKNLYEQAAKKQSKGVIKLVSKPEFTFVFMQSNELLSKGREHPKMQKLLDILINEKKKNKKMKMIIFTQFRETASNISKRINEIEGIKSKIFIGQAKKEGEGLNQKQQKKIIEEFAEGKIDIICATSIAEEGLDIPEVNIVVFYEPVPSAIRMIQRAGRTARLMKGKLIMLITKKTRDEAFFYVSKSREKKMKIAIESIKDDLNNGIKFEIQKKLE